MISFTIDMAPIARMLDLVNEMGETISARTNEGKRLRSAMMEAVYLGTNNDMHDQAVKNISKIAHVYEWDDDIVDKPAKFRPSPVKTMPLWDLHFKDNGANSKMYVEFQENNQWAYYDNDVYSIEMKKPENLGRHVFHDQAEELESVKTIDKYSEEASRYRKNNYGKWGPPNSPRIQEFEWWNRKSLVRYHSTSRDNAFHRAFQSFFNSYKNDSLDKSGQRVVKNMNIDFQKIINEELSAQQSKSLAAVAIKGAAPASMRVQFTGEGGRIITKLPPPKKSNKTTNKMIKAAKKQASREIGRQIKKR